MKHLAAYALLVLGGKESPSADDVSKLLKEVGVKADDAQVKALISALEGKKLHELIAEGSKKLASIPSGGAPAAGAAAGAAAAAPAEAKKEEKVEEEEADVDMGGLFGDDY